jgi:hypothetical protein
MRRVNATAILMAFLLYFFFPKTLLAETSQDTADAAPSDNDLFAAYCLGVVTEQETIVNQIPASQRGSQETLNQNKRRFLGYLVAENMLGNVGTLIAMKNGEIDEEDVFNAFGTTCPYKPAPPIEDYETKGAQWYNAQTQADGMAVVKCIAALPSFQRAKRCQNSSQLPV